MIARETHIGAGATASLAPGCGVLSYLAVSGMGDGQGIIAAPTQG